ncbi:TonB-dependent siderophore myxochelin receptor MxcH [Sorangium sp. So ce854]|uniref:TonB-dependent siderophore myxochelin receptor MxcH n=1 Tax=Sorangium sp. So ce854 TaxID=3133322 RepID=UPI003F62E98E
MARVGRRADTLAALVAVGALLAGGVARAQDAGAESPAEAPQDAGTESPAEAPQDAAPSGGAAPVAPAGSEQASDNHPPVLLSFVEADYPAAALAKRLEGTVALRLTVESDGRVSAADVVEAAGHGFDEAAQAAALRFLFSPARRGDTPVASRILYAYEFRLPEPPASGALRGRVLLPGAGSLGVAGAKVLVRRHDGSTARARTDVEGRFQLEGLAPGPCVVSAEASGVGRAEVETEITEGRVAEIALRLAQTGEAAPIDVTVRAPSEAEQRRQSAEAVTVLEMDTVKRETSDMGEVLARTQGIGVRREGGLGSATRFSLNGLTDDQVRFFLDGVPIELAGYPFGISNAPVALVERVEIYSGVVPVRFGADALGGAVNLVTDQDLCESRAVASYEVGSFDTHRAALAGSHLHRPTGLFARASGFFDHAKNDYPVDVEVADERGRLSPARVYRFHDRYRSAGGNVELGVVDRPWAQRLLLRAFVTDYDKDYQHKLVMTVPYGGVTYGETSAGANLRYAQPLGRGVSLDVVGGYAHVRGRFLDVASCFYDWFGRCVRERRQPGETDARPHDQVFWDHSAFARFNVAWRVQPSHAVRLAIAPTYLTRTGDERLQSDPGGPDPLADRRGLLSLVNGLEYDLDLFEDRLENIFFVKQYVQLIGSESSVAAGAPRGRDRSTHRFGVGDGLRHRFTPWLYGKASYEWATRLPSADEVFGDNAIIAANLALEPETSHNVNLGLTLDVRETPAGAFRATGNGFLREAGQLIVLLGSDRVQSYENVFGARSLGVEGAVGWTSPGEHLALDGNITYVDLRNTASEGTFGDFEGDRIPNRPYLFANGTARLQLRHAFAPQDEVALTWNSRYVHEYFRNWESVGLREFKQVIPSQLVHSAGLGYVVKSGQASLSTALEMQNLTDVPVFDYFGAQRPGRSFHVKVTAAL